MQSKIREVLKEFPQVILIDNALSGITDFIIANSKGGLSADSYYNYMLKYKSKLVSIKIADDDTDTIREQIIKRLKEVGIRV